MGWGGCRGCNFRRPLWHSKYYNLYVAELKEEQNKLALSRACSILRQTVWKQGFFCLPLGVSRSMQPELLWMYIVDCTSSHVWQTHTTHKGLHGSWAFTTSFVISIYFSHSISLSLSLHQKTYPFSFAPVDLFFFPYIFLC